MHTIIALLSFFAGSYAQLKCDNGTLPNGEHCPSTGLHTYPDEKHCSRYWECYNGCLSHMLCEVNYLYDIPHQWCDFPQNVKCGDRDCDGRPCNQEPDDGDDFKCPSPSGYFEDPKNCAKYYQCYDSIAVHHICPKKNSIQLMYRMSDNQCDWPERVDCGNRPICDDNDENCGVPTTTTTLSTTTTITSTTTTLSTTTTITSTTTKSTTRTTTTSEDSTASSTQRPNPCIAQDFECDHGDGFYPEAPCQQCFCACFGAGEGHAEICCAPGLVFDEVLQICNYPADVASCH